MTIKKVSPHWKKLEAKQLYEFIYMKLYLKILSYTVTESRTIVAWDKSGGRVTVKKHEETFCSARTALHLDCVGGGYKNIHICQN